MKSFLLSSVFSIAIPVAAQAYTVYPGCAVPTLKASHHTFYIDPLHGSQSGDGSASKPWHTLAEVLNTSGKLLSTAGHDSRTFKTGNTALAAVNPSAPIKPGDVLMLKSGNHGDVKLLNSFNSDFITVMAAPGQTPILSSLSVVSSGKWIFQGLTLRGLNSDPTTNAKGIITNLASVGRGDYIGTTSDIIIDSNSFASLDDVSGWNANDWNSKPYYDLLVLDSSASCTSATNNSFNNGLNAIAFGANHSLVQGNTITRMRYDGIDFYGSNQTIRKNSITNGVNDLATDILHPDGIQGWSLTKNGSVVTNTSDVVDGNTVIKTGDGNVTQMQGISIFDGEWNGLQIINNVVVSNVWNGIAVWGGLNVLIVNNTVLQSDPNFTTWIYAGKSKTGEVGKNIVIRNNITSTLQIGEDGVIYDHNIVASRILTKDASNKTVVTMSGNVGNKNQIMSGIMSGFYAINSAQSSYDLRIKPNSLAVAIGNAENAPTLDILGKRRPAPVDVGAYVH